MTMYGFFSSSVKSTSQNGRTEKRLSGMVSWEEFCLFVPLLLFLLLLLWFSCDGGSYVLAMASRSLRLCPLSSKRLMVNAISFFVCSMVEQRRYARHNSPLSAAP